MKPTLPRTSARLRTSLLAGATLVCLLAAALLLGGLLAFRLNPVSQQVTESPAPIRA